MARYAGVDWAQDEHAVCVLEGDGRPASKRRFAHDERGIAGMCARLAEQLGVERVAIERPDGLLVERLLEAKLVVLPIHPNQLKAARARFRAAGGKSADELLGRLRSAPRCRTAQAETEARRTAVLALVAALGPLVEQIGLLSSQIAHAVRAHPDGHVFLSLFRDPKATVTAARLLAEIGDRRERYPNAEAMAADAGMCPVSIESGKRKVASFRRACDHRLRDAVATLADATRHRNPWAKDVYRRARARGCDHPHAIRVLGRAWVRVIWRMWQDGLPYDPARHGALGRLIEARG